MSGGRSTRSTRQLRRQLEHVAATPVDGPRPEFADELLARILSQPRGTAGAGTGAPVASLQSARARRTATYARRGAAAVSIAAAAAGVFGVANMIGDDDPSDGVSAAALAADIGGHQGVGIDEDGTLLDADGRPAGVADGSPQMTCPEAITFPDRTGQFYECAAGQTVTITVSGGAIVGSTAREVAPVPVDIELYEPPKVQPPKWSWARYDGSRFGRYELIRVAGKTDDTAMPGATVVEQVTDVDTLGVVEGEVLEADATYQLRVYDDAGDIRAASNLVQVTIEPPTTG